MLKSQCLSPQMQLCNFATLIGSHFLKNGEFNFILIYYYNNILI